jgi:hypothetical protein
VTDGRLPDLSGATDPPAIYEAAVGDGRGYVIERGVADDYSIDFQGTAAFHLSSDRRVLACAPNNPEDPTWRRFLLDTALGLACLAQGYEALHAGAFLGQRGVVALCAMSGGGKSSLLAALMQRGKTFFTDDILALSTRHGRVVGHPGPPVASFAPVLPDGTRAVDVGRPIAEIDGELWVSIPEPAREPRDLTAVVLLERHPDADLDLERLDANPVAILGHSLQGGPTPRRARARFELFADVANQAELFRLAAPMTASPRALAALLSDL